MKTVKEVQVYYHRKNIGDGFDVPPTRITERELRIYLGASFNDVERAINRVKRGYIVRTRFATFTIAS